jgi:hypothetical protein
MRFPELNEKKNNVATKQEGVINSDEFLHSQV